MAARIDTDSRFSKSKFASLAKNPLVAEIENQGMEDGRFFVHLKEGYQWIESETTSFSFGSIRDAKSELKNGTKKI